MFFKRTASEKLNDALLQANMRQLKSKFVDGRAKAIRPSSFFAAP